MRMRPMDRREFMWSSAAAAESLWLATSGLGQSKSVVHICPKSRPLAETLYALRLAELTSFEWDLRLTLTTLQGIVNRSEPRLFLPKIRTTSCGLTGSRT